MPTYCSIPKGWSGNDICFSFQESHHLVRIDEYMITFLVSNWFLCSLMGFFSCYQLDTDSFYTCTWGCVWADVVKHCASCYGFIPSYKYFSIYHYSFIQPIWCITFMLHCINSVWFIGRRYSDQFIYHKHPYEILHK